MSNPLQISKHLFNTQIDKITEMLKKYKYQKVNQYEYLNIANDTRISVTYYMDNNYYFIDSAVLKINERKINIFKFDLWKKTFFLPYNIHKIVKEISKIYQKELELLEQKLNDFSELHKSLKNF